MKFVRNCVAVAFALGAMLALPTGAFASGGVAADTYPATVAGSSGTFTFKVGEVLTTCAAPKVSKSLGAPAHQFSLAPTETESKCSNGLPLKMNGCEIVLHPGSETADIGPVGCGPVTVSMGPCNATISPQTGLKASYSGLEFSKGIKIAEGVNISGDVSTGPEWCVGKTASVTFSWSLATTDEAKHEINLYALQSYVPIGLGLTEEKHPRTKAQYFPAVIAAHQSNYDKEANPVRSLGSFNMKMACTKANLAGGELAKETETAFSLAGTYGSEEWPEKCGSALGYVTTKMNSCKYELPEFERSGSTNTYLGKGAAISCTKAGDAIELKAPLGCTVKIPPQSLTASIESEGFVAGSGIGLHMSSSTLKYTSSSVCQAVGISASGEDGVMNQELVIQGTLAG